MKKLLVILVLSACASVPKIPAPVVVPSKPIFKITHQQRLFERREWYEKFQPECQADQSKEILVSWARDLIAECKKDRENECRVVVQGMISPPRELPSSSLMCELWAVVTDDEGHMDFSLSSDYLANKDQPPIVTKKQQECLSSREKAIAKLSPSYRKFVQKVRKSHIAPEHSLAFTFCSDPRMTDPIIYRQMRQLAPFVPKVEEVLDEKSYEKMAQLLYVHEMSHFLSSTAGDAADLGLLPSQAEKIYVFWELTPKGSRALQVEVQTGTPRAHEISALVLQSKINFVQREKYLGTANDNNFYVLLDEWNAYLNQLDYVMFDPDLCSYLPDSYNSVVEFVFFIKTYLDHYRKKDPAAFEAVKESASHQQLMKTLLLRTKSLVNGSQATKCYRNTDLKKSEAVRDAYQSLQQTWAP
jgi:hypothetical protein